MGPGALGTPRAHPQEVLVVRDKKPIQLAVRLPIIIVAALLVMLAVGIWAFQR